MKSDFRADLHCHSYYSDGSDSPFELLQKAKQANLQGLSITDHDTIEAYTDELFTEAERLELRLLPGVELSSEYGQTLVHVLGYALDLKSTSLRTFLLEVIRRRTIRNEQILSKLQKKGFTIKQEELQALVHKESVQPTIGRPHIAYLMVGKGYVRSMQEAFDLYLREGGSCYVAGIKFTPMDVVEQIHLAGGKAILAHPHFIKKESVLRNILSLPLDGLECYYSNLNNHFERRWIQIARERNWIATGGSDYHGSAKPHVSLGCSWVNLETFEALSCS